MAKLSCRNLWKIYGVPPGVTLAQPPTEKEMALQHWVPALQDISLDIMPGEVFVVMGLSGSGKSTLLRCLSRLVEPTIGQLLFEGNDLRALNERELAELRRDKMGMVFQNFALFPHLTVLENVMFPMKILHVPLDARRKHARELITQVGLSNRESSYPRELSGGQQQRVGIARSLAGNPEVWLLDEPFSALDPLIRREMQDEVLKLQAILKKTVVFITHDFAEAVRVSDRMAILRDGKVIQTGTPEELVLNPATEYVAKFTSDVARHAVISVGAIMGPADPATAGAAPVPASSKIGSVAERLFASGSPIPVVDEQGKIVGSIGPAALSKALFPRVPEIAHASN
ncbi:ATP-binding cassette domain-containing protein [Hyphomicrobium facile]|uniref:Trimethylamine N-oxide transport system ATP-binding protein TmoW n=1 Tax=Hyphomicrobium facile TaxID=51670 RepID=A0A1I7NVI8_9HYPH|nr:ATP-binding cassette domain-containing protein [Hyphomicrobium facile]SFV38685.1 glycine betaine/proline transport system ATP-binding protein [Hyphomicrobium facile]